jgi:hypothetical protein
MFRAAKKDGSAGVTRDEFVEMMADYSVRLFVRNLRYDIEKRIDAPAQMAMNVALSKARLHSMGIRF